MSCPVPRDPLPPAPERDGVSPPAPADWARVSARDHTTRYRRFGTGDAVVVLAPPAAPSDDRWPALARALARRRRVVLPELPAALAPAADARAGHPVRRPTHAASGRVGPDRAAPHRAAPDRVAAWLREFLEGLGVRAPAIVAGEPFWDAALRVGAAQDDLCGRVVLARSVAPGRAAGRRAAPGSLPDVPSTAVAVFVWRWDAEGPDAVAELERCLAAPR